MHTIKLASADNSANSSSAAELVLREAKRLHRAATSASLSTSLPILRRLLAASALPRTTLPELFRRRSILQRKHLLRTLAFEAGFKSWEEYRPVLERVAVSELKTLELAHQRAACLNLWFASEAEAQAFAAQHGGRAVRIGSQAVVLPAQAQRDGDTHDD